MRHKELEMRPFDRFKDGEIIGDLMPIEEFDQHVKHNFFIDYDGYGEFATETEVSNVTVCPSEWANGTIKKPEWATHVLWYNR